MPLDIGTAGAGRQALAAALAALTKRYAGADTGTATRPFVPAGSAVQPFVPGVPFAPAGAPGVVPSATPGAAGGGGALGPYNTAGDGGAWLASGINQYNPLLARGDVAAPGPVGNGPGFWTMDDYGTPFWRSDWDPVMRNGRYYIKGEQ